MKERLAVPTAIGEHRAQMHSAGPPRGRSGKLLATPRILPAAVLLWTAAAPGAAADVTSHPCRMAVAQGSIEERRARYPEALALFDEARREPVCQVEAELGRARTYNSMNDHKKALAAARRVLESARDDELLGEAHYEVARALHKPGKRRTRQKADAEAAYLRAVELTGGEHRAAIRGLLRIYRETRQDGKLADLQERFPDVRASTRADRVRLLVDRKQQARRPGGTAEAPASAPAASREPAGPAASGAAVDCATGEPSPAADWALDLPGGCGNEAPVPRPVALQAPRFRYPEEDRQAGTAGVVEFEVRITAAGEVDRVRIVRSLSPGLDGAVLETACQWRFEPLDEDGGSSPRVYHCLTADFSQP